MPIAGLRDTADFLSDQRPKDWRQGVMLRWPNGKAPLYALTSLLSSKRTTDPEFNWWTKEFDEQRLTLTAAIGAHASGALNITVACPSGEKLSVRAGHVLLVEGTGEQLLVTADPPAGGGGNTTTIATSSAFAGTTGTAHDPALAGKNPYVLVIGTALPEGSNAPTAISRNPIKINNYTQIFRDTLAATRTAMKTGLRTGDQVRESKRECLEYHSVAIERSLWWGKASEQIDSGNGFPRRTTNGVLNFIPASMIEDGSTVNAGGGIRLTDVEDWMEKLFRYGSSEKMGFAGNAALLTLQRIVRKNSQGMELLTGQKEFGMNISRLISPFGEIPIKTHPLFNVLGGGTTAGTPYYGMNSSIVILDMEHVGPYRYITDTTFESKLEANDLDGMMSGYLTECGLEMHFPTNHAWWKNVTKADVDD